MIEINYNLIENALAAIKKKELKSDELLCMSEDQVLDVVGISDQFAYYSESVYKKINLLESNYKMSKLNEDEINSIIELYYFKKDIASLKGGECEDQFQEDFDRIHLSFDRGVIICGIVALRTSLTGLVACNATNVYKTCLDMATAIDRYYECTGK